MLKKTPIGIAFLFITILSACDTSLVATDEQKFITLENGTSMIIANDFDFSSEKRAHLKEQAARMAVSIANQKKPKQVDISDELVNYIYNGIVHLFNSELKKADEITENYPLIVRTPGSSDKIVFWIDEVKPWHENWQDGETLTGIAEIDHLIKKYNLSLFLYRDVNPESPRATAILEANEAINVFALSKLFDALPQISSVTPRQLGTGGRDIEADIKNNHLLLDITVGKGDCPSGCIYKLNRLFSINSRGDVEVVE